MLFDVRQKMIRLVSTLVLLTALTGCDPMYGVVRRAQVTHIPNKERLRSTLSRYPEIDWVEVEERAGSRPVTLTGIKPSDQLVYFNYSGKDVWGSLLFSKNYAGRIEYSQTFFRIGRPPAQSEINASYPVMLRVERDLETKFGYERLRHHVEEHVSGVSLPQEAESGPRE